MREEYLEFHEKKEDLLAKEEEWGCPECEFRGTPETEKHNEGTDADGRRGQMVVYVTCPECEHEEAY